MHLDDGSMELYIDICGIFKIYTIELYFFHQWFKRVDLKDFHEFYHFLKQHENFVKRIFKHEIRRDRAYTCLSFWSGSLLDIWDLS